MEDGIDYPVTDQQVEFALEKTIGGTRVDMTYRYALKPDTSAADAEEIEQGSLELITGILAGLKRLVETGERATTSPQ